MLNLSAVSFNFIFFTTFVLFRVEHCLFGYFKSFSTRFLTITSCNWVIVLLICCFWSFATTRKWKVTPSLCVCVCVLGSLLLESKISPNTAYQKQQVRIDHGSMDQVQPPTWHSIFFKEYLNFWDLLLDNYCFKDSLQTVEIHYLVPPFFLFLKILDTSSW